VFPYASDVPIEPDERPHERGRALAGTGATGSVTMAGNGGNTIGGCSVVGASVPTLPEWAMVALSLLLALAGAVAMRGRGNVTGPPTGFRDQNITR
jgi:hypothetical protein